MAPDAMGYGDDLWEIAYRDKEPCESIGDGVSRAELTSSGVRGSRGCLEGEALAGAGEASTVVAVLGAVRGADMDDGAIEVDAVVGGSGRRGFM